MEKLLNHKASTGEKVGGGIINKMLKYGGQGHLGHLGHASSTLLGS